MMNARDGERLAPPGNPPVTTSPLSPNEDSSEPNGTPVDHDEDTRSPTSGTAESSDEEPPNKMRKVSQNASDDMDGETCPICLDSWSNSGEHRLVALKCGHLFGAACIRQWLQAQRAAHRTCPTCKTKANVRDLRNIYARRLVAVDNSEITSLKQQIDTLQCEKSRVELELQKSTIAHRACSVQLEGLRSLMMSSQQAQQAQSRRTWRFALEKNLQVCKDRGCRVLTYNCRTYELYVSQKSSNSLFPGYGIRKVDLNALSEYSLGQYFHLHPKPIRDITYSQPRDLLLSVALDSTAKIVERCNTTTSINAGFPLWSCSWDYLRTNELYVGGVGGVIHQYDLRSPSFPLHTLPPPGDVSPVISLCSTEFGLLSCQLNSAWLWGGGAGRWEPRAVPVEGAFMSLRYDGDTQRAALLSRPGPAGLERSKLTLCRLRASPGADDALLFERQESFPGSSRSSVMCRAAWVRTADTTWVAAHSESDGALHLHALGGARSLSLPSTAPTLDVASTDYSGHTILAALSDSRLKLYKAVPAQS